MSILVAACVATPITHDPTVAGVVQQVESIGGHLAVDVPDIRPYYWEATVVVAPVRLGAGLRNKVIHAMACHAPVVATPMALEGIAVEDGAHVVTASSAEGLADAIVRTMSEPEESARRAEAAALQMQRYHVNAIGERFERWLQSAARPDSSS